MVWLNEKPICHSPSVFVLAGRIMLSPAHGSAWTLADFRAKRSSRGRVYCRGVMRPSFLIALRTLRHTEAVSAERDRLDVRQWSGYGHTGIADCANLRPLRSG